METGFGKVRQRRKIYSEAFPVSHMQDTPQVSIQGPEYTGKSSMELIHSWTVTANKCGLGARLGLAPVPALRSRIGRQQSHDDRGLVSTPRDPEKGEARASTPYQGQRCLMGANFRTFRVLEVGRKRNGGGQKGG